MDEHNKAVTDVATALGQVLSVSPQLLYEASVRLGSELMVETMRLELTEPPNPKRLDRIRYRASICLLLSRALVQSGRATLTVDDMAAMSLFMSAAPPDRLALDSGQVQGSDG